MATYHDSAIHNCSTIDDLEFLMDFENAIKEPELRKQIISVLESAGLLPLSVRRPA